VMVKNLDAYAADGATFAMLDSGQIAVIRESPDTMRGKGVGACLDIYGGAGPVVDMWSCHEADSKDYVHQQFTYDSDSGVIAPKSDELAGLCLSLNSTMLYPYIQTPCIYPNTPPPSSPIPQSSSFSRVLIPENVTQIMNYGADTFYPTISSSGVMYSGYDDGGVEDAGVNSAAPDFQTGSAKVDEEGGEGTATGAKNWRNLTARQRGGPQFEDGGKRTGRYTSANFYKNGTWWIGSYGGDEGDGACAADTGVPQLCEIMPFVGFRYSTDEGATWTQTPSELSVELGLFGERGDDAIKFGMPHIVDHGRENEYSEDDKLYMIGTGCMSDDGKTNSNCSWISGDAIFLSRANNVDQFASNPAMMNDKGNWEFWCGEECWTSSIGDAKPVFEWHGHVGTVTATYNKPLQKYIFVVTTPTFMPSTVGPYDTYLMEAPSLSGPFEMISYLPKFGQQAYFVSFPSLWIDDDDGTKMVMTFSANFACVTGGCLPNVKRAGYGANCLPVELME